jgi:peptide-methionine (S)-S-oxide reductase
MRTFSVALVLVALTWGVAYGELPSYAGPQAKPEASGMATAVLAGGCFWGVDGVYKHVKGVSAVVSGYAGGTWGTAKSEIVATGTTGHAESVQITYDPAQISYAELLKIFFVVAHDPTELNRQGPDVGPQYRSVIFYADDQQKEIAQRYIEQLNQAKVFPGPIVTQLKPLSRFYPAEADHQNYLQLHLSEPYVVVNDLPKLKQLQNDFPSWYK